MNAGNGRVVPSQMKRQRRTSIDGSNTAAWRAADLAVDAVCAQDEVRVSELAVVLDLALEVEPRAELRGAFLEDVEQPAAADPAEAVAAALEHLALEMDFDVVPVVEAAATMAPCVSGSATRKLSIVWSENTTPQPKVSSGRLRS